MGAAPGLRGFLYFARANAGGAYAQPLSGAVNHRPYRLQIQIPAPLAHIMSVTDTVAELGSAAAHFTNPCHLQESPESCETSILTAGDPRPQLQDAEEAKDSRVTEFNHIHIRDGEDWLCGRSMAFEDREVIRCEARDPDEDEACRRCSEQILSYFGDAMHVQ